VVRHRDEDGDGAARPVSVFALSRASSEASEGVVECRRRAASLLGSARWCLLCRLGPLGWRLFRHTCCAEL